MSHLWITGVCFGREYFAGSGSREGSDLTWEVRVKKAKKTVAVVFYSPTYAICHRMNPYFRHLLRKGLRMYFCGGDNALSTQQRLIMRLAHMADPVPVLATGWQSPTKLHFNTSMNKSMHQVRFPRHDRRYRITFVYAPLDPVP
ncbi:hypothetical protein Mboo_1305 [Methanoregula boonei 6A8]|uniref:Uncharacterized protein n=1 Tax=Methanoregula boonei (strain DSM 21154 / JCM 14090 / 6A8) TaxID=456442 RepID=A7I7W2_METB6|nr:hypothetical protein Mboo_1305 [Methanoregula boonei 6A8]